MPTLSCLKKIFISLSALYYEQLDDEHFNVLFNSVSVISGRHEGENERLNAFKHLLRLGAPVAQWDKRWPTTEHTLSLSTSHRPDMTEILLKRSSIHPSFTADKASASSGKELWTARSADQRFTHCAMGLLSLQKSLAESPARK